LLCRAVLQKAVRRDCHQGLALIEAMFLLESEFKVEMPSGQVPIRNIQDISDLVDQLLLERDAAKAVAIRR
jgi:hypothetical protein